MQEAYFVTVKAKPLTNKITTQYPKNVKNKI